MLTVVSVAVIAAVLYLAKGVLLPLTLAVLLSFLLVPACDRLERWKLGRVPAVLISVILGFSLLGAGIWIATTQIMELAPRIPEYQTNIQTKLKSINGFLSAAVDQFGNIAEMQASDFSHATLSPETAEDQPLLVRIVAPPHTPLELVARMFGSVAILMGSSGIVIVLVIFFLLRREDLRDRFLRLVGRSQLTMTTQAMEEASSRVSKYLFMLLCVNVIFGVSIGIGLYFIGVPHAALWGILGALLRFIPYVGAWSAAAAPILLSLAISPGWTAPLLAGALFVVVELVLNNAIEPWLYGKNTGVSSVALLVAALFWTWLWGPIGLLLATPITVCLLVVGKYVPQLSFLDTMLGSDAALDLRTRVYQRLLAGDQEEAAELLLNELKERPLVEIYDTVLIPALALAELHWHRDEIDEARHDFILQGLRASIEELSDQAIRETAKVAQATQKDAVTEPSLTNGAPKIRILCLPAHDQADEIAGLMLAQVLTMEGGVVHLASAKALVSEMPNLAEQHEADVVCISSTPPAAVMHARYLCKRLGGRFPGVVLIVGLWDLKGDLDKAKERLGCDESVHVVRTLNEAHHKIRELSHLLPMKAEVDPQPQAQMGPTRPTYTTVSSKA